MLRLFDTGLLMCPISIVLSPAMAPIMPTITTMADDSAGMPPIWREISMAMGVDTDLGASERTTSGLAPSHEAISTTDTMPTTHPASSVRKSVRNWLRIWLSSLYSGSARATMAGLSQNSIIRPPA